MIEISKERKEAYVEVLEVLKCMDKKYVEKIPEKLIEFFKDNSDTEYNFILDVPIEKKELKKESMNLLAMLNINYWCEDEEHKKELLSKYYENEIRIQEELLEKYSYEKLFKNKTENIQGNDLVEDEITSLLKPQESFLRKIINKIKKFFNK